MNSNRKYGQSLIKRIQKFEKLDYCLRNAELDLEFSLRCRDNNAIPIFLFLQSLKVSLTYKQC